MLCSELPYSETRPSPIRILYYEGPLVRSSPVLRLLCSEDSIFRTSPVVYGFCVTKVLPDPSFLYFLQVQKRMMCIFWWHKFGLFVPSFMGCAIDKNVITIMGIHNYIYSSIVINGLNRHLDRYVMFQTVRKLHLQKLLLHIDGTKRHFPRAAESCQSDRRAVGSSNVTQSDHLSDYRTFGT